MHYDTDVEILRHTCRYVATMHARTHSAVFCSV
eukprot:COSAG06_NODE_48755_length_330_cov_0.389610_1_plen_32_part_10